MPLRGFKTNEYANTTGSTVEMLFISLLNLNVGFQDKASEMEKALKEKERRH
jgi:hypothetical protein